MPTEERTAGAWDRHGSEEGRPRMIGWAWIGSLIVALLRHLRRLRGDPLQLRIFSGDGQSGAGAPRRFTRGSSQCALHPAWDGMSSVDPAGKSLFGRDHREAMWKRSGTFDRNRSPTPWALPGFVTVAVAPTATGWSGPLAGREFPPLRNFTFARRAAPRVRVPDPSGRACPGPPGGPHRGNLLTSGSGSPVESAMQPADRVRFGQTGPVSKARVSGGRTVSGFLRSRSEVICDGECLGAWSSAWPSR